MPTEPPTAHLSIPEPRLSRRRGSFAGHRSSRATRPGPGTTVLLLLLPVLLPPTPLTAQEWNSPRALELITRAREVRRGNVGDSALHAYSARARGFVYFFLDREDPGERILVKADQIALELFWEAPGRTRQRIVGLRDEKRLPTNIRYHLDHLTVVMDDFGDVIRLGDGDEVSAVLHPLASGSERVYDFLLGDSITLILPGPAEPVRVYEIQVRPKRFEEPGFVGSVYIDRATSAIVRMKFSFTPASYVDPYLDFIRLSLDNGLWLGRYWLPNRQEVEIRREVPYLDFPAGSVIRAWYEIGDYDFNPDLPPTLFAGPRVTALPEGTRRAFPFEEPLYARLETEGLRPPPEMEEIRSLALQIARNRTLSGLGRLRLFLPRPGVSSAFRYDRAEGAVVGAGLSYRLRPSLFVSAYGGFATGRERPLGLLRLSGPGTAPRTGIRLSLNELRDLGPGPTTSGVMNTLAGLLAGDDFLDPYFSSGLSLFHTIPVGPAGELRMEGILERHAPAGLVVDGAGTDAGLRPVRPVRGGTRRALRLTLTRRTEAAGLLLEGGLELARLGGATYGSLQARSRWSREWLARGVGVDFDLRIGTTLGTPPPQALYLLGGRGTLPGYPYRGFTGDRFWLLRGEVSRDLRAPWLRLRGLLAAGWAGISPENAPAGWEVRGTAIPLLSAGVGLGLGWDILRLDLVRGLNGGTWQAILSVDPRFWPWL